MPSLRAEDLKKLGIALFAAVGVPPADAELVADHLVESSLLGHDSHGPLRFPQYVDMVRQGTVTPGAPTQVLRATRCLAQLSGNWNFGPVSAEAAMRMALEMASQVPLAVVTLKECNHVARLGRFAALATRQNHIALMAANGHGGDLAVAPFGGAQRRLPTNPLCLALPTQRPWPLVLDMTTSAISGGALRLHQNLGTPTPPDRLIDAEGRPTTDTKAYYGPPPGAPTQVLRATRCMAQLSGNWNFGPVSAEAAMRMALELASQAPLCVVTLKDCNHVARLGRFAALAARENRIALIAANGHGGDLAVAPFGGAQRRLPTNPLCLALPTQRPWPLVLDMTTSAISGGALRLHQNLGTQTPPDRLIDAEGRPTTDTKAYYGPPPGAMLPLGFPGAGHKGFGLAVMVDILAGALSGAGCSRAAPERSGNALFIALIDIAAFTPLERFFQESEQFIAWIKSSPPAAGFEEVLLPGEQAWRISQQRLQQGIAVDERAWSQISALAAELGVDLPTPLTT